MTDTLQHAPSGQSPNGAEPPVVLVDEPRIDVIPNTLWALVGPTGIVFTVVAQADEPAVPGFASVPVLAGATVSPGDTYADGAGFSPAPAADPAAWLIDVGPFFDRFGMAKMALLMSSNATVKALVADLQVRKWVDLRRPDVAAGLDALIQIGVPGVNAALKAAILETPVTPDENLALRVQFFGGAR